jgi:hypothetical protein
MLHHRVEYEDVKDVDSRTSAERVHEFARYRMFACQEGCETK